MSTESASLVILVIDDEARVRDALIDILDMMDMTAITASTGYDGIAIYAQDYHQIHIVLLDMQLPDINGSEIIPQLKEINPDVKIIISSGHDQWDVSHQLPKDPNIYFLQKPYRMSTLFNKLNEVNQ
ncbi:MAG TPA: response regulator [Anaerolineae bacterium]|nr:response regulator [Anaerolineae bacterium]